MSANAGLSDVRTLSYPNEQQLLVDELIFKRDVNEGFLLIDYISGRSEKSLKDLDVENLPLPETTPAEAAATPVTPSDVWRKFCEMRYPPGSEPGIKAENAAFVLEVKDRLNALARPARGLTIAYTTIFVGNAGTWLSRRSRRQQTLVDQAGEAFPSIAWHASLFGRAFGLILPLFLLIWFLLTAFTYWDVGYNEAIVQTLQQLENQHSTLVETAAQSPGAAEKLTRLNVEIAGARANLLDFYRATVGDQGWNVLALARPIRWGFLAYRPQPSGQEPEQSIIWVLTLFGSYVLPAMFGLLGTMAAVVRAVQVKVRDSLLSPRDLSLSLLGLLTGPLAGLAVGLFFTPAALAAQGTTGLASSVTLTTSGLGFLAGYGADAFFKFLDALLVRIFALEGGTAK